MHIIVLERKPTSLRGGAELSLFDVCRSLSERGHTISLVYIDEGDLLERYREFCVSVTRVGGYKLDYHSYYHRFKKTLQFIVDLGRIPVETESVVYSNRYYDALFGYILSLTRRISYVCHLREPPYQNFLDSRQLSFALKRVDHFIAISNQTKLDWLKTGLPKHKFSVVHNGIDPGFFKPPQDFAYSRSKWQLSETTRVIAYVGRLDKIKGLETLIKAFALVAKKESNAKVLIAGKPLEHHNREEREKYFQSLVQLSIDLGIKEQIKFLGHLKNPVSLYQISDVTVLPSLWSEPFGRTVIESMSCGTPVVASRIGGIPEILTGEFSTHLFEPGNEYSLGDSLINILDWRREKPQLGQRCREHVVSKFNLLKTITGIEESLLKFTKSSNSIFDTSASKFSP